MKYKDQLKSLSKAWDGTYYRCTICIPSLNNSEGLNLLLASIIGSLNLSLWVEHVVLRLEGTWKPNFYREQLIETLKVLGIPVTVCYAHSIGSHALRDWQLYNSIVGSRFVLFLDDDVILDCRAIDSIVGTSSKLIRSDSNVKFSYLQGTKWDCSNTRGYKDFSIQHTTFFGAVNYNVPVYYEEEHKHSTKSCYWLDTGFALFDRKTVAENDLTFVPLLSNAFTGGEDALFALQCESKNVARYWVPTAQAIHLEKETLRFSDHGYRKEAVLRAAEQLKYPTDRIQEFLSWVPIRNHQI